MGDYSQEFFDAIESGSLQSATIVAPLVLDLIGPVASVADVGCGSGHWMRAFGADTVVGYDGSATGDDIVTHDLSTLIAEISRFDLAVCLEVAEHLDAEHADTLIDSLCNLSDVVLFSAAVPGQGGTHHVNEQWVGYWYEKFLSRGYVCVDLLRDLIWDDGRIEPWYRQNILLYMTPEKADALGLTPTVPGNRSIFPWVTSPKIGIVIPWQDRGDEHRRRAKEYVETYMRGLGIGEVYIGTYPLDDQPFNISRCRNEAVRRAVGDGCNVLAFCDADYIVRGSQWLRACEIAYDTDRLTFPYDTEFVPLGVNETSEYLAADPVFHDSGVVVRPDGEIPFERLTGGAAAISIRVLAEIGGWDEAYIGWSPEDMDMYWACTQFFGPARSVHGGLTALWHDPLMWDANGTQGPVVVEDTKERSLWLAGHARLQRKQNGCRTLEQWRDATRGQPLDITRPRVCVYGIAKNEAKHVARWAESAKDADVIVLVDTGSTDDTVEIAKNLGIVVHQIAVQPWRFDDARNTALALLPGPDGPDGIAMCVSLDIDEILEPGWRAVVNTAIAEGATHIDAAMDTGRETYLVPRVHARTGYRWVNPCHEVISPMPGTQAVRAKIPVRFRHLPDNEKSRGDYLPLLETGHKENPTPRSTFYLAREYGFHGRKDEAADLYEQYLAMPDATWRDERSAAMIALSELRPADAEMWLLRACAEAPWRREPWVSLAKIYQFNAMWEACLAAVQRALGIREPQTNYFAEAYAWGSLPEDIHATALQRVQEKNRTSPPG